MLTKRGIKNFCIKSIGVFVVNPEEDFIIEKWHDTYIIKVRNVRANFSIIKREWDRFSTNTKYARVYIEQDLSIK